MLTYLLHNEFIESRIYHERNLLITKGLPVDLSDLKAHFNLDFNNNHLKLMHY